MIKALFDIRRIHVGNSSLYYEIYYKHGSSYHKVTDKKYLSRAAAIEYIQSLLDEV